MDTRSAALRKHVAAFSNYQTFYCHERIKYNYDAWKAYREWKGSAESFVLDYFKGEFKTDGVNWQELERQLADIKKHRL